MKPTCPDCGSPNVEVEMEHDEGERIFCYEAHPQQAEDESTARLLAEIAEQTDASDDADFYDPSDRF